MISALEALINETDVYNTNDDTTDAYNNNDDVVVVIIIVGVIDIVGNVVNILCFVSTGLYWPYLEGGPCKTED